MCFTDRADGLYDFGFKLYDSPSEGMRVGSVVNIEDVDVIDAELVSLDMDGLWSEPRSLEWMQLGAW